MAKSTIGGVGKRRLPQLTRKGKPLSQEEVDNNINNWIEAEFIEELRLTAYLDFNTRRQIRIATGVGDMDSFVDEFNDGFINSSTAASPEEQKELETLHKKRRPKLKKINQEYTVAYRPPKK